MPWHITSNDFQFWEIIRWYVLSSQNVNNFSINYGTITSCLDERKWPYQIINIVKYKVTQCLKYFEWCIVSSIYKNIFDILFYAVPYIKMLYIGQVFEWSCSGCCLLLLILYLPCYHSKIPSSCNQESTGWNLCNLNLLNKIKCVKHFFFIWITWIWSSNLSSCSVLHRYPPVRLQLASLVYFAWSVSDQQKSWTKMTWFSRFAQTLLTSCFLPHLLEMLWYSSNFFSHFVSSTVPYVKCLCKNRKIEVVQMLDVCFNLWPYLCNNQWHQYDQNT